MRQRRSAESPALSRPLILLRYRRFSVVRRRCGVRDVHAHSSPFPAQIATFARLIRAVREGEGGRVGETRREEGRRGTAVTAGRREPRIWHGTHRLSPFAPFSNCRSLHRGFRRTRRNPPLREWVREGGETPGHKANDPKHSIPVCTCVGFVPGAYINTAVPFCRYCSPICGASAMSLSLSLTLPSHWICTPCRPLRPGQQEAATASLLPTGDHGRQRASQAGAEQTGQRQRVRRPARGCRRGGLDVPGPEEQGVRDTAGA